MIAIRRLALGMLGVALAASVSAADTTSVVSLQSLLEEIIDRDAIARWPEPAFTCKQASSYDRRSKTPSDPEGWFANDDWSQFLRSEEHQGHREWVMMDADGPGSVVRFWTGGKPATGTVRFYLDGADEPALAEPLQELLSGRRFVPRPLATENPKDAGNLSLPIPYAKHCKITYEETDPKNPTAPPTHRWYNIEYRTYTAGAVVKTFTKDEFQSLAPVIERVKQALLGRPSVAAAHVTTLERSVEPGKELSVELPPGPSAVRLLEVRLGTRAAAAWRSLVLRAEFDGEESVWAPLGDFFGSGIGVNVLESWNRGVARDGTMTCRWVMPYKTSARLTFLNLGKRKADLKIAFQVSEWNWDGRSMRFHANWRQQNALATRPMSDWNYLTTNGKGVYVGDTLCVFNSVSDWWGEGDEKVWVDGEKFPSHFGTGSEDHYCYAWGDGHLFQGPFANQVRCDGPGSLGHTVITRTRCLDAIPFTKSLQFDMEVWHWKDCKVTYAATTYWYALPGATSNRRPMPDEAVREIAEPPGVLKLKGAIECETMAIVTRTPDLRTETQRGQLTNGRWSNESQLFVLARNVGDFVELRVAADQQGSRKVVLYGTKSWDYGVLRFRVNGKTAEKDYDAYNATSILSGPIELGVFEPKDGQFTLRVTVIGANPASKGTRSYFGMDAVTLQAP